MLSSFTRFSLKNACAVKKFLINRILCNIIEYTTRALVRNEKIAAFCMKWETKCNGGLGAKPLVHLQYLT